MKEFEIWSEGYAATGERAGAHFHGKAMGETFEDACKNFREPNDIKDWEGKVIVPKGSPLNLDKNRDGSVKLSIWACRLFDNETDARKSFG
jgi:hypothetical protein